MKKLFPILLILLLTACEDASQQEEGALVRDFLENPKSLSNCHETNPIIEFQKEADESAEKVSRLNQFNILDILEERKNFKYCVITVADHTIVNIGNVKDCEKSGSWGACMPFGEGYIKRGDLSFQSDYLNNIIGRPDNQERMVYYFEELMP